MAQNEYRHISCLHVKTWLICSTRMTDIHLHVHNTQAAQVKTKSKLYTVNCASDNCTGYTLMTSLPLASSSSLTISSSLPHQIASHRFAQ